LRHEVAPEICAQMASLYRFVFSRLVDANVNKDVQAVDDALKVLRHQRETWAILADKIQKAQSDESPVMQQAEGVETPQDSISLEG
ncbi:MAG: flagellar protein FliS, partial [Planctomycetes bacterium]|nr:flagellar protein FliS [Planctomycetota bacterium]